MSEINNKMPKSSISRKISLPKKNDPKNPLDNLYDRSQVAAQLKKLAGIYSRMAEIMSSKATSPEGERIRLGREAMQIISQIPGGCGLNGLDVGNDGELLELRMRCYDAEADLDISLITPKKTSVG